MEENQEAMHSVRAAWHLKDIDSSGYTLKEKPISFRQKEKCSTLHQSYAT